MQQRRVRRLVRQLEQGFGGVASPDSACDGDEDNEEDDEEEGVGDAIVATRMYREGSFLDNLERLTEELVALVEATKWHAPTRKELLKLAVGGTFADDPSGAAWGADPNPEKKKLSLPAEKIPPHERGWATLSFDTGALYLAFMNKLKRFYPEAAREVQRDRDHMLRVGKERLVTVPVKDVPSGTEPYGISHPSPGSPEVAATKQSKKLGTKKRKGRPAEPQSPDWPKYAEPELDDPSKPLKLKADIVAKAREWTKKKIDDDLIVQRLSAELAAAQKKAKRTGRKQDQEAADKLDREVSKAIGWTTDELEARVKELEAETKAK